MNNVLLEPYNNKHTAKRSVARVFVSSTWIDLEDERKSVEQVLQRFRETKFVGMEYFGSRPGDVRSNSLAAIRDCQLYIGIVGRRYGSGITEAEYRTARENHLPCLIYFQRGALPGDGGELIRFRNDLRREHTVTEFSNALDLAANVASDLHNWLLDHWLPTWFLEDSVAGMSALTIDYASRVQNFLSEYLGNESNPVPFGGRGRELAQLDEWLDDSSAPPYALLAAPAGRGKSAQTVRWSCALSAKPRTSVIFLPISIRFRTNLASVVFASLATRLASAFGEDVQAGADTTMEMWRGVVQSYLRRPAPEGNRIVLVLDGLDEAADWEAGADLFPKEPPATLKILVTTRYRAGETGCASWLETLDWTRTLAKALELPALTCDGVRDVVVSMGAPLDKLGAKVDLIWELFRLSEGDPIVVRLYMDDLWTQGKEACRLLPEDLRSINPGLEGYFQRWWREQRTLWDRDAPLRQNTVQAVLNLLACALGPLAADDVLRLAPDELNTWSLEDALEPLQRFIIGDGRSLGYVFSHPRLGIYFYELLRPVERHRWDNRFLLWGAEMLASLGGADSSDGVPPYLVQYYGAHLERSGAGLSVLLTLVADGWRRAWFAFEGGYAGFLNDVDRAWRTAERRLLRSVGTPDDERCVSALVLCALCFASVRSLAANVRPRLLAALVDKGIWTPAQALTFVRQAPSREYRQAGLSAIVEDLPPGLLEQAVSVAEDRVPPPLIGRLAKHGNGERVIGLLSHLDDVSWLAESLTEAGRHLKSPALDSALALAGRLSGSDRIGPILSLAAALPEKRRQELLEHELELAVTNGGPQSIERIASALSMDAVGRVADAANFPPDANDRWLALAVLANHLEPRRGTQIAKRIVAEIEDRSPEVPVDRITGVLGYLCPLVDASTRERLLDQVPWERISSTTAVPFVQFLNPLRVRRLLGLGTSSMLDRLHLITVLSGAIPDEIWDELLSCSSKDLQGLEALAFYYRDLPARVKQALYTCFTQEQEWEYGIRLLAPCLTISELHWANSKYYISRCQDIALREALAVRFAELNEWSSALEFVDSCPDPALRDRMLCALAPIAGNHPASSSSLLDRARKSPDVPEVMGGMAEYLPRHLVVQALDTTLRINDQASQASARRPLAAALFQAGSVERALCFAYPEGGSARDNWLATQTSRLDIAGSLKTVRLIQHADLRDGCVRNILAKVPAAYFTGGYEWGRADILSKEVLPIVRDGNGAILWRRLELLVATTAADIPELVRMVADLSPKQQIAAVELIALSHDEVQASVPLAQSLADPHVRAEAFELILRYKKTITPGDRAEFVNAFCREAVKGQPASAKWKNNAWDVIRIADGEQLQAILIRFSTFDDKVKGNILDALRSSSPPGNGSLLGQSLDPKWPFLWEAVEGISDPSTRAEALASALALAPSDQVLQASSVAFSAARQAMAADPECVAPFVSVCEFIGEADWPDAWRVAKEIRSEDDRAQAIAVLAARAPISQMAAAVQFALKLRRSRPDAFWLRRLGEQLPEPFRSRVLYAAFRVARRKNKYVFSVLEQLSEAEVSLAVHAALKFNDNQPETFVALWAYACNEDKSLIRRWFDEQSKRRGKDAEGWMISTMPPKALLEHASSMTDVWERILFLRRIEWRLEEPDDVTTAIALMRDIGYPQACAETVEQMVLNRQFTHRVAAGEEAIRLLLAGYPGQRPMEMLKATKSFNIPDWEAAAKVVLEQGLFAATQSRKQVDVPLLAEIADGLGIQSRNEIFVKLLRFQAEGTRAEMLNHFNSFLPWFAAAGGVRSLEASAEALSQVVRWWP